MPFLGFFSPSLPELLIILVLLAPLFIIPAVLFVTVPASRKPIGIAAAAFAGILVLLAGTAIVVWGVRGHEKPLPPGPPGGVAREPEWAARARGTEEGRAAEGPRLHSRDGVVTENDSVPLTVVRGPSPLDCPDDLTAWKEAGRTLGFQPVLEPQGGPPPPWVENAAGSTLKRIRKGPIELRLWEPGPGGLLVAYSGPEDSPEAAVAAAEALARKKIALLVLERLEAFEDERPSALPVALDLVSRRPPAGPAAERPNPYLERALRPYGPIYRAAVLRSVDYELLKRMAQEVREEIERGWYRKQVEARVLVLSLGAVLFLALAVFAAYVFLNAGTKGHFAWPLRIASLIVFLALSAAVLYVRSKFGG